MVEAAVAGKRRGRPRSVATEDGPGSAVLSARIRSETRRALDAAADRTGRSISQVADAWLTEAAASRASLESMLGGSVAVVTKQMIEVTRRVQDEIGDPLTSSAAYHALSAAFDALSDLIPTDSQRSIGAARSEFIIACTHFLHRSDEVGARDIGVDIASIVEVASGRAASTATSRRNVRAAMNAVLERGPEGLSEDASDLLGALDKYEKALSSFVKDALAARIVGQEMLRQSVSRADAVLATDILADLYRGLDSQSEQEP